MKALLVTLAVVIGACSTGPHEVAGLTCDRDDVGEVVRDVDPGGTETARDALAGFVFGAEFQGRADWVALERSDAVSSESTHVYVDSREFAQLIVELNELPGGWYVSSYRWCA